MRKFKDGKGREWSLSMNVMSAKRVKNETGVDLLNMESLSADLDDVYKLVDVLWSMVSKQAEKLDMLDTPHGLAGWGRPAQSIPNTYTSF